MAKGQPKPSAGALVTPFQKFMSIVTCRVAQAILRRGRWIVENRAGYRPRTTSKQSDQLARRHDRDMGCIDSIGHAGDLRTGRLAEAKSARPRCGPA
jgi:hypothetical protein